MSVNCRFALDEKRYVIDAVNVANSGKAYWPAPDLDDTQLGESSLSLELHRAQIPDRRVPSL